MNSQKTIEANLKLDANERCDGPPEWALKTLREAPESLLWRYPDRKPLEAAIAKFRGLQPDQVLVTNGGDEAILCLFSSILSDEDVLLPLPTFGVYHDQAAEWSLTTRLVEPLEGLRLDQDGVLKQAEAMKGGLIVLVRPNNPTGEVVPKDFVIKVLETAQAHGTRVLLDEAYAEFADDDLLNLLASFENLFILRTFSKAYGLAGLRVGYLLGAAQRLEPLRTRALPFNVSHVSLALAERALEQDAQTERMAYCHRICAARDDLFGQLRDLGVDVLASQANYLCLNLGEKRAAFVANVLNARGIKVRRFSRAGLTGCLRLTVPLDAAPVLAALKEAIRPDLICLDVDRCLIDVSGSYDAAIEATVLELSGQATTPEEIQDLRAQGGFNDDYTLSQKLIFKRGIEARRTVVIEVFQRHYLGTEDAPGAVRTERSLAQPGLLDRLAARFKLALITGRPRPEAEAARAMLGLDPGTPIYSSDDVTRGKPDPEGILSAKLVTEAQTAWMIGDNPDDIEAALSADVIPIGVAAGDPTVTQKAGAFVVLDDINEIEVLL